MDNFLTVDDLCEYLNLKRSCVYSLVESGCLPCYRIGRLIRFKKEEVDQWMEGCRQGNTEVDKKAGGIFKTAIRSRRNIDSFVNKSIAEVKALKYTPRCGRPGQTKDLGREG